jgi:hypothetical protein
MALNRVERPQNPAETTNSRHSLGFEHESPVLAALLLWRSAVFIRRGLGLPWPANLCPGGGLGLGTLNKWLDINSPGHMPSLLGLAVLCQVLGEAGPLAPVLEYLGLEALGLTPGRCRRA